MWVREIAGYGYFGGKGRGYPSPDIFWSKSAIFHYFSHISAQFKVIGPQKFWGSVPPALGATSPLNFFWRSRLGLARCFHVHYDTVGLSCFWPDFGL